MSPAHLPDVPRPPLPHPTRLLTPCLPSPSPLACCPPAPPAPPAASPALPHSPAAPASPAPPATGELLDLVRSGELAGAVDDCLAAAATELDPLKQASLLKASCYGRAFRQLEPPAAAQQQQQHADPAGGGMGINGDPRRQVVEVARRLRVLNALRDPGACLPAHAEPLSGMHCGAC